MRSLLSIVGAAYTSETFARESASDCSVLRVLQNEGVARSVAASIASEGVVVFLAADVSDGAPCEACAESWVCHRCDGAGGCEPSCDGVRVGGTGGRTTYRLRSGRLVSEPRVVFLWRRRRASEVWRRYERSIDGGFESVVCPACGGSGKARRFEVFGAAMLDRVEVVTGRGAMPAWYFTDPQRFVPRGGQKGVHDHWTLATVRGVGPWEADVETPKKSGVRRLGSHWAASRTADLPSLLNGLRSAGCTSVDVGRFIPIAPATGGPLWLLGEPRPVYKGRLFRGVKDWRVDDDGEGDRVGDVQGDRGAGAAPAPHEDG